MTVSARPALPICVMFVMVALSLIEINVCCDVFYLSPDRQEKRLIYFKHYEVSGSKVKVV